MFLVYTAGYVPQCLIKEIKKSCDPHKTEFLTCLSEMGTKRDPHLRLKW